MRLKIGITDYVPSPFSVERQALGDGCELVNLNVHSAEDFAERMYLISMLFLFGMPRSLIAS